MYINEAALIAQIYGYGVTQGNGRSIFIMRKSGNSYGGDSVALIGEDGQITPYVDDYNSDDHLVATALSEKIQSRRG